MTGVDSGPSWPGFAVAVAAADAAATAAAAAVAVVADGPSIRRASNEATYRAYELSVCSQLASQQAKQQESKPASKRRPTDGNNVHWICFSRSDQSRRFWPRVGSSQSASDRLRSALSSIIFLSLV